MSTTTPNLGLTKPAGTDLIDISVLNGNFDILDGTGILVFQTLTDLQTAFPNGYNRPVWVVADNDWYYWTGTVAVNASISSVTATSTIAAIAPIISTIGNITVSATIATMNTQAIPPIISVNGDATVSAILATATAQASIPTLSIQNSVTVSAISAQVTTVANTPTVTASSGSSYVVQDTFTGTDGTDLSAHTPDVAPPGKSWVTSGQAWKLSGNQAVPSGSTTDNISYIDSGKSDCTIQAIIKGTLGSTNPTSHRIGFRAVSSSNFHVLQVTNTQYQLWTMSNNGGTYNNYANSTGVTPAVGDVVQIILSGSSITVKVNGATVITTTSTVNQTATYHGMGVGNPATATNVAIDNFSVA